MSKPFIRFRLWRPFVTIGFVALLSASSACGPDGGGGGEDPETTLEYGFPTTEKFDCSNSNILDALDKICNLFAHCDLKTECDRHTVELFTGTTLQDVTEPKSTYWNEFGSRGEVISDAGLCMLKDLSKGQVHTSATAKLLDVFPITVKQTLGFLHYDVAAKSVDVYHTVSVCLPVVGCFDAKEQTINAQIKRRSPAHPTGKSCGNFPVEDSFALQVTSEESSQTLTAAMPSFDIETPYGPVTVTPSFNYFSDLHSIMTPLSDTYANYNPGRHEMHLYDAYGRIPGVNIEVEPRQTTPAGAPFDTGWMSYLGLGSRQPDAHSDAWTRDPDHPLRPDFDFGLARSDLERKPVAGVEALARVSYRPPLPEVLNDGPISTDLLVFFTPKISTRFASQLGLFFNEFTNDSRDAGGALKQSVVQMLAHTDANASLGVEAGLDLKIDFHAIFSKTLVDAHPRAGFEILGDNSAGAKGRDAVVGAATSSSDPRSAPAPGLDAFASNAAGAQRQPLDYVKSCLGTPVADQPKPEATFTPGDPSIMNRVPQPCNICVGYEEQTDGNTHAAAYSTVLAPSRDGGPTAWTCNQYHSGCMDLCELDPGTNQRVIVQSALDLGLRGQPRNLGCNENPPR